MTNLRGQAAERARGFADDGKGRVTGLLEDVSEVINDAARSVDERLGEDYGDYAHRAADAVAGFAGRIRDKSVDDILDDTTRLRPQEPGGRDRHRRGRRLRADAGDQDRPRRCGAAARGDEGLSLDAAGGDPAKNRSATCSAG